jgi:hypothetical protein
MIPRHLVKIRPKTRKRAALKAAKLWRKPVGGDSNPLGTDGFEVIEYTAPVVLSGRNTWVSGKPRLSEFPIRFRVKRLGPLWFWRKARNCH